MSIPRTCARLAAFVLAALPLRADVWIVGGAGADFSEIQPAVDAAAAGDVLLVESGDYAPFVVDGKSVTLVPASIFGGAFAIDGEVRIQNLPVDQDMVVVGLRVNGENSPALVLENNAGALRFYSSFFTGAIGDGQGQSWAVARITECDDVAFAGCSFTAQCGYVWPDAGGTALVTARSKVAVFDGVVRGGCGVSGGLGGAGARGGDGGHAIACESGTLFVSGTNATGGQGGVGGWNDCIGGTPGDGGNGGNGVHVFGAGALAQTLDVKLFGGLPGFAGGGSSSCGQQAGVAGQPAAEASGGVHQPLSGSRARLIANTPVAENTSAHVTIFGDVDDLALLFVTTDQHWSQTPFQGVFLGQRPVRERIVAGTIFSTGWVPYDLALPADLGPGVESITWYLQALVRSAATGEYVWSGCIPLVILDSAFL